MKRVETGEGARTLSLDVVRMIGGRVSLPRRPERGAVDAGRDDVETNDAPLGPRRNRRHVGTARLIRSGHRDLLDAIAIDHAEHDGSRLRPEHAAADGHGITGSRNLRRSLDRIDERSKTRPLELARPSRGRPLDAAALDEYETRAQEEIGARRVGVAVRDREEMLARLE